MADRERWTVYPLIFLTLGIALKDKLVGFVDQVQARNVVCNALVVTDQQGKQQVVVASDPEGGSVRTHGNKNGMTVVLGNTDRLAGLMLVDRNGQVRVNPGSIFSAPIGPPEVQGEKSGDEVPPPDPAPEKPTQPTPETAPQPSATRGRR